MQVLTVRAPLNVAERLSVMVILAGSIIVPLLVSNAGADKFRMPKELLFRAEAIVLLVLGVFRATARHRAWVLEKRIEFALAGAIVGWSIITTLTSTNRPLSQSSLITILASVVIFIATCLSSQSISIRFVDGLLVASCTNGVIVVLQELKVWSPFPITPETRGHYGSVGLLGNTNDAGTFLAIPIVAGVVLAAGASGARRLIYTGAVALLAAGLAATGARTAWGAVVIALGVLALRSLRHAVPLIVAVLMLGFAALAPATSIGSNIRTLVDAARGRDLQRLSSERLVPFLTAIEMTRDHPILGVGPGCFKYQFMTYRVALSGQYPAEWTRGFPMNWDFVHNDYLQVAAESGLPALVLFLAAIGVAAGIPELRRPRPAPSTPEATFARELRWPLATCIVLLCMAQFPLGLAAPRLMIITLVALSVSWDRGNVEA